MRCQRSAGCISSWLLPKNNHAAALAFQGTTSTLTLQARIQRAEHASARRIQRWYRKLRQRKQYEHNIAAKELRQQGVCLKAYLLQKVSSVSFMHKLGISRSPHSPGKCLEVQAVLAWNVTWLQIQCIYSISICCLLACHFWLLRGFVVQVRNAEEHGRQQERLLTATQQSCDLLKQQVQDQDQQLQEQRQHAEEVSPHQASPTRLCISIILLAPFIGYKVVVSQLIVWLKKPIHLGIGMLACISTFALNLAMLLCSVLLYA